MTRGRANFLLKRLESHHAADGNNYLKIGKSKHLIVEELHATEKVAQDRLKKTRVDFATKYRVTHAHPPGRHVAFKNGLLPVKGRAKTCSLD